MSRPSSPSTSGDPVPRPHPRLVLLSLALVLPALLAGCTGDGEGPNTIGRNIAMSEKGSAEANLQMDAGARIDYSWNTTPDRNVSWDLHTHENGTVTVLRNGTATSGNGTFEAPRNGTYSLFWQNQGNPMRLGVRITGDFTLESFPIR